MGEVPIAIDRELMNVTSKLAACCYEHQWSGYDPYDALNSSVFQSFPFLQTRMFRIAFTQVLRRSPFNFRRVLGIPATQNAKAIALFLSAFLNLEAVGLRSENDVPGSLIEKLQALRSSDTRYWSWGYSFPWQGRTLLVPASAPNLVCTAFVASSLLDAYERRREERCLKIALSAAEYILNELYWTVGVSDAGFSYPLPGLKGETHNANFLAAALFCRLYRLTGEKKFVEPALRASRFSASRQKTDGSWYYGEAPSQRWIDNFHTGYKLCALHSIGRDLTTSEFDDNVQRGLEFYRDHFFRKDGAPRYFHNQTYPIDIHCVAQSIITLVALRHLNSDNIRLAQEVFRWAKDHMWDQRGFFYYRVLRALTIRTSYMRWSQAWMLLALSTLLREKMPEANFFEPADLATI